MGISKNSGQAFFKRLLPHFFGKKPRNRLSAIPAFFPFELRPNLRQTYAPILFRNALGLMLALCIMLACVGCGKKNRYTMADVQTIVVKPIAYAEENHIFTFDFAAGTWMEWYSLDVMPFDFPGSIGETGAWRVHEMPAKRVSNFLTSAEEAGFLDWRDAYTGGSVLDGTVWEITITFTDGKTKTISCFHAYPMTWDDMGKAFYDLTKLQLLEQVFVQD